MYQAILLYSLEGGVGQMLSDERKLTTNPRITETSVVAGPHQRGLPPRFASFTFSFLKIGITLNKTILTGYLK
jgi:hypothetical protein